jgi:hypothetical protein
MPQLSEQNRRTLLTTLHRDIHQHARDSARAALQGKLEYFTYPPNVAFSTEEATALSKLREVSGIQPALEKVIADAAASVLFHFFNYVDGTGDPAVKNSEWTGVSLVDLDPTKAEDPFLHETFFDFYWAWHDAQST